MTGGLKIGYARVSTGEQTLDLQLDALAAAGCTRIYQEKVSGVRAPRPEQQQMRKALRPGDTVVVWKLDRLGRDLADLIQIISDFESQGIEFESLTEKIDTSTASGRMMRGFFALMADYERDRIKERTLAGLNAARARGRVGGRRPTLGAKDVREIKILLADPLTTVTDVAARFNVSRTTIYKYLSKEATQHVGQ